MLKNIFIVIIACIGFANFSYSQIEANEQFPKNEIPEEQVYLHLNSCLLFSGEKLLYKFYCINPEQNKLSDLSKIGWVILVNSDKEKVFQHKLNLKRGQAYSDFSIPSNLPSGAYKILGYTSWMLNAEENYFEQDIHILNPYQKENKGLILEESVVNKLKNIQSEPVSDFEIQLNKNLFSTREEVVVTMDNIIEIVDALSISVRRIDSFNKPARIKSTNYNKLFKNKILNFSDTLIIPEVRGSLVRGKVTLKDRSSINSKNLILSFPGEPSQVNIISIGKNGDFNFTINNELAGEELLMQLIDHTQKDYSISLIQPLLPDLDLLIFEKPVIQQNFKDYILDKSVNIQIDNAYSATKADRTIFKKDNGYFFDQELIQYNLDDYKRFPGVAQTFVEIIEYGRVKRNGDESHIILVGNKNANDDFSLPALLIVDGVVVQNHDLLVSFDSDKIQSIGLLRSKYFFGPEIFQGVVVVETKKGNFPEEFRGDYNRSAKLIPYQKEKKYYIPNYKKEKLERIPDYRYQLLWNPEAIFTKNENTLRFYTSDLDGKFEINLEGFTSGGKPISISKTFEVK
ncbi:MAG: hypothetical protein ACI83B_002279 [Sediminicola sp.]|jgi:hypothetical protein